MKHLIVLIMMVITCQADNLTARIIFAETGPAASTEERVLVASVIYNRIGHEGFDMGKLRTAREVVTQSNQFESLNDKSNSTWVRSKDPSKLKGHDILAWNESASLSTGRFAPRRHGVVYFHDKSIDKPSGWDNKYWSTYKITETKHFIFYGVKKNE